MQQTRCEKIVVFVEGTMERMFVNSNFPYIEVVSLPNGESWTPEKLGSHIISLFQAKDVNAEKIIVWFDREANALSQTEIKKLIISKFQAIGVVEERLAVCIPDKMSENIILADEALIRKEFSLPDYKYAGDGCHGKSQIKQMYANRGMKYKETVHGVQLLKKLHLSRASETSEMTKGFTEELPQCWWNR